MKDVIKQAMSDYGISTKDYRVYGNGQYYQITIRAGLCISINNLKQSIYNYADTFTEISVSCINTVDFDYCLMIEIYWYIKKGSLISSLFNDYKNFFALRANLFITYGVTNG